MESSAVQSLIDAIFPMDERERMPMLPWRQHLTEQAYACNRALLCRFCPTLYACFFGLEQRLWAWADVMMEDGPLE